MRQINIPVGISDFRRIRENGYYYVDKSGLIEELLAGEPAAVTLITRPRRFGKTLGMNMLAEFFDIRKNSGNLFENLKIAENRTLCGGWMNRFPTLFLSFRDVDGLDFSAAYGMLCAVLAELCVEHSYLLDSERVTSYDKVLLSHLVHAEGNPTEVKKSLHTLLRALYAHYGIPVILLIDEYDVPVAKATSHGYYPEMLDVMKGILQPLKDNACLHFAVITGCLRIAKESIFTGTNNFVSDGILHAHLDEYFGFTQADVDQLLKDADARGYGDRIKNWYDGYRFGDTEVYCPWDVMNYLRDLQANPDAQPAAYWKNTSDNAIIRSFIEYAGASITQKLELLLRGESILQGIDENLTYDYLHSSEDNLWSILYLTGYLTRVHPAGQGKGQAASLSRGVWELRIPNAEIREIFETTIMSWFAQSARSWNRKALFAAVWTSDSEALTQEMNKLLRKTISYHDYKEDFYHAFLAGIFAGAGYMVESNKEHGEGRSDVIVYDPQESRVAIFEAKYSPRLEAMERDCQAALQQMDDRMYAKEYEDDYDQVLCYGISFFRKRCLVRRK